MRERTQPVSRRLVFAIQFVLLAVCLALWELGVRWHAADPAKGIDPFFYSSPSLIGTTIGSWWNHGYIGGDIFVTMEETVLGLVAGGAIGIALAVVVASSRLLGAIFVPFLVLLNSLPRVTLVPLFILWFGFTLWSKVVSAIVLVLFVVFFATYDGINDVDPTLIANVRVMGASRSQVMRHVLVPSALTWIFSSLRTAVGFALIGAVVAEYFGAQAGVGYRIQYSEAQLNTSGVFAGLFILMVLVFVINVFIERLQRVLLAGNPPPEREEPRMSEITRRRLIGSLAAAGASTVFGVPTIVRAAGPKEKVPVTVGADHAMVYLPWDLAKALGYFDAEGLDVELTYTKGGSEAATALVSGTCDYSGNAIDHAISAAEHGKSLVMLADFMNQPGIALMIRPADREKYKTFADFKGKTIGVTSIGSATHVLALYLAKRSGLGKDDLKIVGVGASATMISALVGNQVDAAYGTDPYATTLMKSGRGVQWMGLYTSAETRKWLGFPEYCFTGALTRADVVVKNPDRTQKIVNALVRAQKFMATKTSAQIAAALSDEFRGGTPVADWAAAYSHSRPAYTQHGEISIDGVRAVIETNSYFLGVSPKVDPAKLFDTSFADKAARSVKV
jgi:NitT/TauT family transport system permease protein